MFNSNKNPSLDDFQVLHFTTLTYAFLTLKGSELGTFEWWISGLRLDPLFFLISRLNNAFSPLVINLQDIPF